MRILLDTHTLIWASEDPTRLGPGAITAINDLNNERFISVASIWEMAIKRRTGKLSFSGGITLQAFVTQSMTQIVASLLDVRRDHALLPESLPFHHGDPFDRLLIAQCLVENMAIVSVDAKLDPYGVTRLW